MLLVLALVAVIWGIGHLMGAPKAMRWMLTILLWAAVVLLNLTLPAGHGLRVATGGSAALWVLVAGAMALIAAYRLGLSWLRARVRVEPEEEAKPKPTFSETELNRYARHIVMREVGGTGQKRLKNAKVLVIGAGGIGSPALMYLAAAGVGTIGVIDDDVVDNSNLQRQVIHRDADIGTPKVFSAERAMRAQNPFVAVRPYQRRLDADTAADLIADYDIVLDGTDNFDTRYLANRICAAQGKPLVSGALSQWEGQISVFHPKKGGPCYQCVFADAPAADLAPSCAEAGVISPLPGVIGAMMAVETMKLITGAGAVLRGEMMIYDALWGETRKIRLQQRDDCPVCGDSGA
jgi:molybdopterin/thiamine biosynthesis adenylyltransferase